MGLYPFIGLENNGVAGGISAMDDLSLTSTGGISAVPEPVTGAVMVAGGLLAFGLARLRRTTK